MSVPSILERIFTTTSSDTGKLSCQAEPDPQILVAPPQCQATSQDLFQQETKQKIDFTPSDGASLCRSARIFNDAIPMSSNLSTSSLYFSDTKVGISAYQSFTITNNGDSSASFSLTYPSDGFTVSPTTGTLNPKGSLTINVTFSPIIDKNYSGYINFTLDGLSVSLNGKGVK